MALWITDSGASTAEIKSGTMAAQHYFDRIGWRPDLIWKAMNDGDSSEMAEQRARDLWSEAETIAFKAAFEGWHDWPEAA